ncbi:hypothetical protein [Patulibacter minatonensis]|uniref:hypothetical protein n=1 Tax=Patulibacter minatonensis TaxID=298163 RepID=UPI0004796C9B|nr:hypothetical protein [Patulibacter minatonensis]
MLSPLRRALPGLAATGALVLAGCGGAGYGDPIAATDGGGATVALAPAPITTPGATSVVTREVTGVSTVQQDPSGTGGSSSSGSGGSGSSGGSGPSSSGGGDSGAGELAAYAADANRFCSGFNAATKALTADISAGQGNPKALGRAAISYGTAISSAAEGLKAAPPPSSLASYHRDTLSWVSGITSVISANRSGLQSGDTGAQATVIKKVQDLGKPPSAPASLRSRASACTA